MPKISTIQGPQTIPLHIEKQLLAVEMIDVKDLVIDHNYQRDEDLPRQAKMAREWDWNACGYLSVSLRKGRNKNNVYAVIDGQQRLGTIRTLGYDKAPCKIYVDLSKDQEAELYEKLNSGKQPTYNDLFKSRLARGEEKARAINLAVEQIGYHLDFDRKHAGGSQSSTTVNHFYLQTMRELDIMYEHGGVIHIMDTLRFLKACFAGESLGKQAMIFAGMAEFLKTYGADVSQKEMIEKIRREGQAKLVQSALAWQSLQGKGTRPARAFCEAMVLLYNRNRHEGNRVKSKH